MTTLISDATQISSTRLKAWNAAFIPPRGLQRPAPRGRPVTQSPPRLRRWLAGHRLADHKRGRIAIAVEAPLAP
jgi:hypothetical protein